MNIGKFPCKSEIVVDAPENALGVTPFTDPWDGTKWYGVMRSDLWWMFALTILTVALLTSAATAIVTSAIADAKRFGIRSATDSWTDEDGVYHDVTRLYSSHDYDRILAYESRFRYTTETNLYREVKR